MSLFQEIADAVWLWKECVITPLRWKKSFIQPRNYCLANLTLLSKTVRQVHYATEHHYLGQDWIEASDTLSSGLEVVAFTSKHEIVGIVKCGGFTKYLLNYL